MSESSCLCCCCCLLCDGCCCCCCVGTITPHGADVWSYDPNEDCLVTVPRLGEYLSHWGIDIMKLEKTELTLGETEVKTNLNHNWNLVQEQGEKFELVSAPGCIGLTNIGSSCYMNVILQTLFAVEEVNLSSDIFFSSSNISPHHTHNTYNTHNTHILFSSIVSRQILSSCQ